MDVGSDLAPLIEAFRRNGRVNAALLDAVTEADFGLSDGPRMREGSWQRFGRPLRHMSQCPQKTLRQQITWSPGFT